MVKAPAAAYEVADDPRQDALFAPPPTAAPPAFEPGDFSDDPDPDNPFGFAWRQGTATPDLVVRASVAIALLTRRNGWRPEEEVSRAVVGQALLAGRRSR